MTTKEYFTGVFLSHYLRVNNPFLSDEAVDRYTNISMIMADKVIDQMKRDELRKKK